VQRTPCLQERFVGLGALSSARLGSGRAGRRTGNARRQMESNPPNSSRSSLLRISVEPRRAVRIPLGSQSFNLTLFTLSAPPSSVGRARAPLPPRGCRESVITRLAAIPRALYARLEPSRFPRRAGAVHQGGEAAVSCRLCLTACNLRHFGEVPYGKGGPDAR
jgi:hypothetical protein